jgi:hypothetical protein
MQWPGTTTPAPTPTALRSAQRTLQDLRKCRETGAECSESRTENERPGPFNPEVEARWVKKKTLVVGFIGSMALARLIVEWKPARLTVCAGLAGENGYQTKPHPRNPMPPGDSAEISDRIPWRDPHSRVSPQAEPRPCGSTMTPSLTSTTC